MLFCVLVSLGAAPGRTLCPPPSRLRASPPPRDRAIILTYTLTSPSPDDCVRAKKETILRRDPNLHPNLRCPNWLDAT